MAKENISLPHLLKLSLLALALAAADGSQVCLGTDESACEPVYQRIAGLEEQEEAYGLELVQVKGQKKLRTQTGKRIVGEDGSGRHSELKANATQKYVQQASAEPFCKPLISGVDDAALSATLAHERVATSRASNSKLVALRQQKIFIAACLHESEEILPHWTSELVRLLLALTDSTNSANFFVSVYESGSSDGTVGYMRRLNRHLKFIGIPSKIVTGGENRNGRPRIEFIADIRNKALEPLQASTETYDHVLWLNDNMFCADGVLQLLAHSLPETKGGLGADAVCGMDYFWDEFGEVSGLQGQCLFYDRWVSHDIAGNNFRNDKPIIRDLTDLPGPGNDKLESGEPFQVFSCWNGMVAFSADIFQKQQLRFRSNRPGECAAGEAELIFRDMWNIGRGKIVVSPRAASAYHDRHFYLCAEEFQPQQFDSAPPMKWQPKPETVNCCPLQPNRDFVEYGDCFKERLDAVSSNTSH